MFSKVNETMYLKYTYVSARCQRGEQTEWFPTWLREKLISFLKNVVNKQLIPSLIKCGDLCNCSSFASNVLRSYFFQSSCQNTVFISGSS